MAEFSRRRFLQQAAAGATVAVSAGALAPTAEAGGGPLVPKNRIGVQLYTIRDKVSQLGFRKVFEELSRIGYREVEFAGYTQSGVGPITVEQIRQLLDDNGLKAAGSHLGLTAFRTNMEAELDKAEIIGTRYIGTPQEPVTPDKRTVAGYQAAAEEFNRFGAATARRGIKWYQHNHSEEFGFARDNPSVRLYDVLLAETDPRLVYLQMDVFWAFVGQHRFPGFEPAAYVKRFPKRFPLFHLKDGTRNQANPQGYDMGEFGAGDLPYQKFLTEIRSRGQFHGLVEQDNAPGTQPDPPGSLGAAERGYRALIALRR